MSTDKIAALRRTALFNELDENTLRALSARAIERQFQKDEVLFIAGEEAYGLYVIVEGAVRAFRESEGGRELMEAEGFEVQSEVRAPMHLLEPRRLLRDEGLRGTLRFIWNVVRDRDARARMLMMRSVFRRYQSHLAAVMLVGVKR